MSEDAVIIGGGPCGLAAAIALKEKGFSPVIIEKENIVHSIYRYPTHQQFFSTSDRLEIGGIPFIIEERKPKRNQALAYYREVVRRKNLRIHAFEKAEHVVRDTSGEFQVLTDRNEYRTPFVIMASGFYDHPQYMNIPGEDLPKVHHYFKESHPYFDQDVVVIGGKNSAVDATLELEKAGARVTVLYRGADYSPSVKPWILPEFQSLFKNHKARLEFAAKVKKIEENHVVYEVNGEEKTIANDVVFAMTGYHPDHSFLRQAGIKVDADSGRPSFREETMETNVSGVFIAGVIAAGNNANEIFIETGRHHGTLIADEIEKRTTQKPVV